MFPGSPNDAAPPPDVDLHELSELLKGYSYHHSCEKELQEGIGLALRDCGIEYEREQSEGIRDPEQPLIQKLDRSGKNLQDLARAYLEHQKGRSSA